MSDYEIAKFDLEKVKRMTAKFPSNIPRDVQQIPVPEKQQEWAKLLAYNGLWLILTYGADLISMVSPIAGKAFRAFVKWKFNYEQKSVIV